MSRIGKQPVGIPAGVDVKIKGSVITVKGPKGELTQGFDPNMTIKQEGSDIIITRPDDQRRHRALHGTTRAMIQNMMVGVHEGYEKRLTIMGTGYRAEEEGKGGIKLSLGFSHDIVVEPPEGLKFVVEDRGTTLILTSHDKQMIGQVAADIRRLRPPEPYQGKGVRYEGEIVRLKAGKAGKVGA